MLLLTPPGRIGEFYGLYGMAGRFSAVLGPLLWGFVSEGLGLGRPAAVTSLLVFILVAMVILRPLPNRSEVDDLDHGRPTS
jgi:UMF1 family MFS transporter